MLSLASEMQQWSAHRQPQCALGVIPPPSAPQITPLQTTWQAQVAPSQAPATPLTRESAIHLIAPQRVQLAAPTLPQQIQPGSFTPRRLRRQKTLIATPQVTRRRCRFAVRPLCREGALHGEAAFHTPRPLIRTYAFYGEFPKNEHLPLLSDHPFKREHTLHCQSTLGLPLPAPTRRVEKKGVKFMRRPAGPSAKAAVLRQPKSILKKSTIVTTEDLDKQLRQDSPTNAKIERRCFRTFSDVGDIQHWAAADRWVDVSMSQRTSLFCKGCGRRVVLEERETYQRMLAWKQHKERCWGIYNVEEQERKDLIYRNNPLL